MVMKDRGVFARLGIGAMETGRAFQAEGSTYTRHRGSTSRSEAQTAGTKKVGFHSFTAGGVVGLHLSILPSPPEENSFTSKPFSFYMFLLKKKKMHIFIFLKSHMHACV